MKPNQCAWCKQFRKPENLTLACNNCLSKNQNESYNNGFSDAWDVCEKLKRQYFTDGMIKGFFIGIITIASTAILCIWMG